MTIEELREKLKAISPSYDHDWNHCEADEALLEFINDPEVSAAFNAIAKWYA